MKRASCAMVAPLLFSAVLHSGCDDGPPRSVDQALLAAVTAAALPSGGFSATIQTATTNQCLVFAGNGTDLYPSRFLWGNGASAANCGFNTAGELLANQQAVFTFVPIKDDLYVIQNASNGRNQCLIFGSNGTDSVPSRFMWSDANASFCGFGSQDQLLQNRQAVWRVVPLQGNQYALTNASSGQEQCLSTSTSDLHPSRRLWGASATNCGFSSLSDELNNGQPVWTITPTPGGQDQRLAAATRYAPLIYLAQGERYLPSSVEFFAPNVHVECQGKTVATSVLSIPDSAFSGYDVRSQCNLVTNTPLAYATQGDSSPLPGGLQFLTGQDPSQASVPVYVSIYPVAPDRPDVFNVEYKTFYPYNYGKNACTSLAPADHCLSDRHQFDDHVGDWEGMSIQFTNYQPSAIRVGAHASDNVGTTYYAPRTDLQWSGDHPIVYSAIGSHGVWATAGDHNYFTIVTGDRLVDTTSPGIAWQTWNNVVVAAVDGHDATSWYAYKGRWGNPEMGKVPCDFLPVTTVCAACAGLVAGGFFALADRCFSACALAVLDPHQFCANLSGSLVSEFELNGGPQTPPADRDRLVLPIPMKMVKLGGQGNLEVFAVGTDGTLYHNWLDGSGAGWHNWEQNFQGAPKVSSIALGGKGDLQVFAVGTDGTLYHNYLSGKDWHNWEQNFDGAPKVSSVALGGEGDLQVFAVGSDGALYHDFLNGGGWHGWAQNFDGAPRVSSVALGGQGDLQVFAVGSDGALYHDFLNGGGWHGWAQNFDGAPKVSSVALGGQGDLQVFAVGSDGALYHDFLNGGGWHGWAQNFDGAPKVSSVELGTAGGDLQVFAVGTDGTLHHDFLNGDGWHSWLIPVGNYGFQSPPGP